MTKWKGWAASCAPLTATFFSGAARIMAGGFLPLALVTGLTINLAWGANLYWDVNNTAIGIGGSGNWDTTSAFWNTTGNDVAGPFTTWNNANLDNAIFNGTAGTVTLTVPITVGGLTFNVSGYTIAGTGANTLTLGGATPTITVNSGSTAISSVINSTVGLTKAGSGTLTLSANNSLGGGLTVNGGALALTGTNTFVGDINVNAGGLTAIGAAALGDPGNSLNIAGGTSLSVGTTGGTLTGRTITLTGAGNVGLSGAGVGGAHFTGTGGLNVNPGVNLTDNTNNYTGATNFYGAGTTTFTSIGNLGEASALGAPMTVAAGTIDIQNPSGTAGNRIASYIGDGDVSNRNWTLYSNGYRSTGISNDGTGTLTLTGTITSNFNPYGGAPSFTAATADLELLGAISGNGAVFGANAGHVLRLGNANTVSGVSVNGAGKVEAATIANVGVASSLGAGSGTSISGTLSYTGAGASSNRNWALSGTLANDGTGVLALSGNMSLSGTATLGGGFTGADNMYSGVISGAGNLRSGGSGTWVLSGANTYTGSTIVASGVLRAGSATAFGATSGFTTTGGTLDLNGFDVTTSSLTGTGGTIALGGANLSFNLGTGVNNTYGGSIVGAGNLTKLGAGTLTLTGQSTYTGATTIGGGGVVLDFSPAGGPTSDILGASSTLVMNGGTFTVKGAASEANAQSVAGLTITGGNNTVTASSGASGGSLTLNLGTITRTGGLANFVLPTAGAITTANADGVLGGWATVNSSDYAKVLGGKIVAFTPADYINKDDASTWLSNEIISDAGGAANTPYFGTVSGNKQIGGLQYTAAANSTVTVGAGNTLGVDGTIIVAPSVGGANQTITGGSMTGTLGGGVLGVQQNGLGTFTIASTIADNTGVIGFTKAGTGKVALTGASTYTGATTVAQGILSIGSVANAGQVSAIGAASVDPANLQIQGAALEYTGATASTDRGFAISKSGAIVSDTVSVTNAGTNLTVSGQVVSTDGANFFKDGPGTLTLAGSNNSYTGTTTVNAGTLAVTKLADGGVNSSIGASSAASSSLVLQNGGKLDYIGTDAAPTSNRGFTLGSGGGGISVSNATTTLTLSGTATGGGGLTKTGAGTLVLTGTNNYSGGTTLSAGTLRAGPATNSFGTGSMTVASGATLDLANNSTNVGALGGAGNVTMGTARLSIFGGVASFSGVISGTDGVTLASGTETFSGCHNTYSGPTILQGNGTLNVGCLANGGQPSDIGASSNASTNLVFSQGALNYTGATTTTDRGFQLLANTGAIGVASSGTTLTMTGQAFGAGTFRKDGPGTLVLTGNNIYTGGTIVNGGTLRAGSTTAFGTGVGGGMTVNAGSLLDLNNFSNTMAGLTGVGNVSLGSATVTINGGGNLTFSGAISGAGSFVKTGTSGQGLSGCNNSYTGNTTISGGTLVVSCLANGGVNSSIGASSAAASNLVLNGGTLQYVGAGDRTDRQFTLGAGNSGIDASGTGAINFTSTAPATLTGSGNRTLTLSGTNTGNNTLSAELDNPASGVTGLTKTGAGTWVLKNSVSSYTGVTTISGGVLAVDKLADGGQASSLGASSSTATNLVIGSGSTLRYTGSGDTTDRLFTLSTGTSFIESSGTGPVVFSNTGSATYTGSGARTLALGGTNTGLNTMGGAIIDGPGGTTTVAKNDSGTWALTGNNSFTGNTVINNGNLMIGNGGTTGNAGAGNVIVANPTSTLSLNRSDTFTFAGTLSGPGKLAQIGTGTSVLTSSGNQIAATAISAGTLQVNGGLTTPTIAMTGTSSLTVNGAVGAAAGTTSTITGDAGASTINIGTGTLTANGDLGGGNDTVNLTGTLNTGAGTLSLGAGNDTLVLNDGGVITGIVDAGTGGETSAGDTLQVVNNLARTLDGVNVTGFESLNKQGAGTLTLTGSHSYSAGTTISAGTLQIGNGATAGALTTPTVTNNSTLAFNLDSDYSFASVISGNGAVTKLGTGTITLTGTNSYKGATNVNAGTLLIDGNQSAATGQTTVAAGAILGGNGIIGGSVTVANGGTLSPGDAGSAPGRLTINGNLALGPTSNLNVNFGQANVPGGSFNDLINVGGNLTLDGTLNVTQTPGGTFGPGVYRIFNYAGSLTDNGLAVTDPNYFVQTAVANQVNLVNSTGLTLSFWDGDAGPHSNSAINGGNGTWRAAGDQNWTDSAGLFAAPFANASFAIFHGAAGTVTVDGVSNGQVQATGMQFATGGYVVQGDAITLVDDPSQAGLQSVIRIGDGTAAGAAYVATINSALSGGTELVKTDLGTLMLSGTNSYTGGTAINGGTVEIASDTNLGDAAGGLSFDGGTLHNTAAITTARGVTLNAGGGTFDTDADLTLNGTVGGAGALTKTGSATLALTGTNNYAGGTVINGGTIQVAADTNLGNAAGALTVNGGTLHSTGSFTTARDVTLNAGGGTFDTDGLTTLTLAGAIGGAGALDKDGAGTLVLTADNSYAGGTTIAGGTLQLGNGGANGAITGDVVDNGALVFNRGDTYGFAGLVSGTGGLEQIGTGTTILTADNSYAGDTTVQAGTLIVDGDQSAATGFTTVEAGSVLGGTGTIGGDVTVQDGAALNPSDPGTTPGTLTINGSLALDANAALNFNFGQAGVVGGPYNDLTVVHGDLTLDGAINVAETPGGNFGPGIYRVISYDGALTDLGLSDSSPDYSVQTSVNHQVNLVNTQGVTLNYWDGDAGTRGAFVNGGNGTWRASGDDNWTGQDGALNAAFTNGSFAVFTGAPGTVDVDNTNGRVQASGMQFATGGYAIQGQSVELVGPQAIIRVGDGTTPGAGYVATIASALEGSSQLVKTDLGTLVLTGTNTYTGGTEIRQGTLQFSSDANLGDAAGGITLDGGTLRNAVAMTTGRGVTLGAGGGTFETVDELTLNGTIGGVGGFAKTGSAGLILNGNNSYAGPTTVAAGSLYINGDQSAATGPLSVQNGATLGGTGTIGGNVAIADGGVLNPGASDGTPGTLAIAGNLTLSSGSVLNYSLGQANTPGGVLNDLTTIGGNLVLDGTLNVSVPPSGTFGPGVYRLFSYGGALTNNGLSFGTIPSSSYFIQTAVANQVNLVNTDGLTLNYWDGTGPKFDGVVDGGDGVWQNSTGNDNWADSTGVVNAPFSDDAFAVFAGKAGKVTVDNSLGQVTASGLQFMTDGYTIDGGSIKLDGPGVIVVGDGTAAGLSMTATIGSELTGSAQLTKTDLGTLVLTGANSYTGGTAINGGMLQVSNDANLGGAAGGITLDGGTLHTTGSFGSARAVDFAGNGGIITDPGTTLTLNGVLSGIGMLTKSGAGTLALTADSSGYTGTTSVEAGTLSVNGSLCGDVNVRAGGRLQGTGIVCDTNNYADGTVAPGDSIGTLTVAGNYMGAGGTLEIEAELGGDASRTDRLVVTGDTSGTSAVKVINVGGTGAPTVEGIKIIDVGGASNGTFSLAGDYVFQGEQAVIGGAYAYRLYKGGVSTPADGDWYLRSILLNPAGPADPDPQPLYAPGVPLYETYAGVLQSFNELGTLQQRVGNRSWGNGEAMPPGTQMLDQAPANGRAIWARIEAAHADFSPATSTTGTDYAVDTWKLQLGLDGLFYDSQAGSLIGGITAHYGTASSSVSSVFGSGSINVTGYGVGGTLTWYGTNGFYVDTQAQATWYDSDIKSATLGTTLADGNKGFGYALSVEGGQKIALRDRWSLTPQAQLIYSSVNFDDFTDRYGAAVSLANGDSLVGRLGLSADYEDEWKDAGGQTSRTHVYGIGNLYYDFLAGSKVDVSGASLVSKNQDLWGGLGLGGSLAWGDGRYSVYGEAFAKTSLKDFGDSNSIGGKIGFSVKW